MSNEEKRRYRWPWVVLAVLLLGVVLFVLWMRVAVERVREYRFSTTGKTMSLHTRTPLDG